MRLNRWNTSHVGQLVMVLLLAGVSSVSPAWSGDRAARLMTVQDVDIYAEEPLMDGNEVYEDSGEAVIDDEEENIDDVAGLDGAARCRAQFRSFEPESGLYTGYDGIRRPCPYL